MPPLLELEGTWEAIMARAPELAGRRVRLTVLNEAPAPAPNEALLKSLRACEELERRIPLGDRGDSVKIIREGR